MIKEMACPYPVLTFAFDPFTLAFFAMVSLTASVATYFTVLACIRIAKCWSRKEIAYCPNPESQDPLPDPVVLAHVPSEPIPIPQMRPQPDHVPEPVFEPRPQEILAQIEHAQDILRMTMDDIRLRMEGIEDQLEAPRGICRLYCPACRAALIFDEFRRGEWLQKNCITSLFSFHFYNFTLSCLTLLFRVFWVSN